MYKVKYVPEEQNSDLDICYETDNLTVFVQKEIADIIHNTTMLYKEDTMTSGIVFQNPNEVGKCGCGLNFKLENTEIDSNNSCDKDKK